MSRKFEVGNKVYLNGRTPQKVDLRRYCPRTVVEIIACPEQRCCLYKLGSNGKGETKDGNPMWGFTSYLFRSYQLVRWHQTEKVGRPKTRHFGDKVANQFRYYVRIGVVSKPSQCPICRKDSKIEGHHDNYLKPFMVAWCCKSCHKKIHSGEIKDYKIEDYEPIIKQYKENVKAGRPVMREGKVVKARKVGRPRQKRKYHFKRRYIRRESVSVNDESVP